VSVPRDVREQLRHELWKRADALEWAHLSSAAKAKYYRLWSEEDAIGGQLAHYMDWGSVRLYLKDTLLDDYTGKQQSDDATARRVLGIAPDMAVQRRYTKPHGQWLADGRLICWGRASDWKLILMALFERTHGSAAPRPYAAVFQRALGRYSETSVRCMVEAAASKLGIEVVKWV